MEDKAAQKLVEQGWEQVAMCGLYTRQSIRHDPARTSGIEDEGEPP